MLYTGRIRIKRFTISCNLFLKSPDHRLPNLKLRAIPSTRAMSDLTPKAAAKLAPKDPVSSMVIRYARALLHSQADTV